MSICAQQSMIVAFEIVHALRLVESAYFGEILYRPKCKGNVGQ